VNRIELIALMREVTVTKTTREWIALFQTKGVPCGPINNMAEVFADEQVIARGTKITMQHPSGEIPLVASPIKLSDTPVEYRLPPPQLGQHTDAVLSEFLSLSEDAITQLRANKVIT
jgi:crotonobetainyl-CoA:carnitine CoA-transferase CaiB-like acyl-CoA transferase